MQNELSLNELGSYSADDDLPEMPEECEESEKAIEALRSRSDEERSIFINIVVIAVTLLACAAYFIATTSSRRFSDEGNKFSLQRLANGKFTAEISKRYYSTIAYPKEIKSIAQKISGFYGIGGGVDYSDGSNTGAPGGNNSGSGAAPGARETQKSSSHNEQTVTTAETTSGTAATTLPHEVQTIYDTVFSRTTTVSTELGWDPDDPYSHKITITTTTNNDEPDIASTTTAAPQKTDTSPSTSETELPPEETPTASETDRPTVSVTEEQSGQTEPGDNTSEETGEPTQPEAPEDPEEE